MILPDPVSLFWIVNKELEAFLRIVLETELTVAPFKVNVPVVLLLLPTVNTLVLAAVISIAPIDKLAVPIFIPAVVAVPEF